MIEAWPKLAGKPAADVTDEDVADMIRRLFVMGHGRTANKLRSYMRAAFQVAKTARTNGRIPAKFKEFKVMHNPAADVPANPEENRADKDPLSSIEMRTYWQKIKDLPGRKGAMLRIHLLTGGLRIEQLLSLKRSDTHADTIVLMDGKGRPGKPPRSYATPLLAETAQALKQFAGNAPFTFSTDGGATHISSTTMSGWAKAAVGDAISKFKLKRIRSGVETLLAYGQGVSKDIRGRLQSHGITGVQDVHYDGNDYLPEKRVALELLLHRLKGEDTGNVVSLRHAA